MKRNGGITMAESTAEDLRTLRAELANLRADLGRISDTLKDTVRHGRDEAVGKAHDAAEKLQDEIGRRTQRLSQEIEQKPLTAVFTAFGLGIVLGLLFRRHRS
jgi:ElaB/YqjD/DUF883 family membrane-anchored ribosome-binding protein